MNYAPGDADDNVRRVTRRDSFILFLKSIETPLTAAVFFVLFVAGASFLGYFVMGGKAMDDDSSLPVVSTEARIELFYPETTAWGPARQFANVKFSDGYVVSVVVPPWAWHCRAGDTVKMQRQGRFASVERPGCSKR